MMDFQFIPAPVEGSFFRKKCFGYAQHDVNKDLFAERDVSAMLNYAFPNPIHLKTDRL